MRSDQARRSITIVLFALICLGLTFGCSSNKRIAEATPTLPAAPADQTVVASNKLPPPEPNAVRDAVKRVLKDAAVVDTTRNPSFVAGDFNGDLSQDLAVIIKPDPQKLSEMNEEFPTFILRDRLGALETKSPRLRIAADEQLLAIIHGFGADGWRDPQATQTYVLKNAVGSEMESSSRNDFIAANTGKKTPPIRGDVVRETIQDQHGYLYYAGATYAWYDPLTFTEAPPPRRGHGAQLMKP